ncbi:hypothetical protein KQX54_009621 [Cotesia glomerata]|uniref:CCDC66 domain-containing protein n=1 Tax=Cotesia glomerata TaxID=32391 RepID=A0AAV7I553_COTGL|nr:hypothetical protein KQX54_009621 [Cotesia glomerata]
MTGRISLVEQKRLQWAKEREEMARLNEHWNASKPSNPIYSAIRSRMSTRDYQSTSSSRKPLRACEDYGSAASLKSIDTASTSLRSLNFPNSGSMINIVDCTELPDSMRRRSPSLPPIYSKEHHQHQHAYKSQELPNLEIEGSRLINQPRTQKHSNNEVERDILIRNTYEEREGETSGYASDSIEPTVIQTAEVKRLLPLEKSQGDIEMSERLWQNSYYDLPDPSLPPSRKFASSRLGELNRPRWGSIWNQDNTRNDLPPPSWLERGLSRLDHSSQVLVINHDNVSSPDSSTGSTDSKTYLRGHNIPVDAQILQEREARRQKALELQSAIKQQLEEKDRRRKEEKERKLREELEEEERIKRERDKEKLRYEEEQRKLKEKEDAKLKKEQAMKKILETAERLAKEEKRQRRQRDDFKIVDKVKNPDVITDWRTDVSNKSFSVNEFSEDNHNLYGQTKTDINISSEFDDLQIINVNNNSDDYSNVNDINHDNNSNNIYNNNYNDECYPTDTMESCNKKQEDEFVNEEVCENVMRLNKDVAIVLTGRLEDTDFLTSCSPRIIENRLLTPSKYRVTYGRDFGTQTDAENDSSDLGSKDACRGSKESVIRRDTDKNMSRSKSQPRQSIESRPRWNANSFVQAWDAIQNAEREGSPLSETYEIEETTSGFE